MLDAEMILFFLFLQFPCSLLCVLFVIDTCGLGEIVLLTVITCNNQDIYSH